MVAGVLDLDLSALSSTRVKCMSHVYLKVVTANHATCQTPLLHVLLFLHGNARH